MENKLAATIRFHPDGEEAELYRKIQEGKEAAGLSLSEYVKKILQGYFADAQKRQDAEDILQEIREEYRIMAERIERIIRSSIQEHDAAVLEALEKMGAEAFVSHNEDSRELEQEGLPKESSEVPEGTMDFLNGF